MAKLDKRATETSVENIVEESMFLKDGDSWVENEGTSEEGSAESEGRGRYREAVVERTKEKR